MTIEASQHWCAHVAPAREKCRKTAGSTSCNEEMNIVWCWHDRNSRTRFPFVPFRQVAVIDLTVATMKTDVVIRVRRIFPQIFTNVLSSPAVVGDRDGVFRPNDHSTRATTHCVVVRDCAHRGYHTIQHTFWIIGDMIGDTMRSFSSNTKDSAIARSLVRHDKEAMDFLPHFPQYRTCIFQGDRACSYQDRQARLHRR